MMTSPPYEYDELGRHGSPATPAPQHGLYDSTDVKPSSRENSSASDASKGEAEAMKDTVADSATDVADSAKSATQDVVAETRQQAGNLLALVRDEVETQAGAQQQNMAGTLHSLVQELEGMATNSTQNGPLTQAARQGATKGGEIADWLQDHEPRDLLREVRSFARRRPVAFLAACGAAGVVAGRLSRAIAASDGSPARGSRSPVRREVPESHRQATTGTSYAPEAGGLRAADEAVVSEAVEEATGRTDLPPRTGEAR
ncbi:hypothetical protein [Propionimicrobium sp. PCR01-08-3]|uniref:hypothetical protein n=1 Tax=Propionimicrobium sp. PCR01-08-3 TaxID=3052086 RepID=UPI00255CE544|nr:hypothetical protein [Propionimicrobium sp. PCR01-08-3]WIY82572.1 hypothetical protein QQ658_13880 [Propionimicrobium sp. PCR01-08-3]